MTTGDKIKLFKFIQKTYRQIGIDPPKSDQNRSPLNSKNCFFLIFHAECFITTAAYLCFEANSMIEYGMAFYVCVSISLSTIFYLTLFWQMQNVLNFIKNCDRFIEKSEYILKRKSKGIFISFKHFVPLQNLVQQ